jgi:uncharacterized repeat protein (TIGR03803 family)
MKTYKAIVVALLLGACPAAWADSFSQGTNYLANTNLLGAYNSLASAVKASPADPGANVYYALTRLLVLPSLPAGSNFLTRLGVTAAGRNIYDWQAKIPQGKNMPDFPASLNLDEFTAEFRTNILPALAGAETNLAQISDPSFTLFLPRSVTHFGGDVTIDYGDAQMLRAMLDAAIFYDYTISSWNFNATVSTISNNVVKNKSIESLLTGFPDVLKLAPTTYFPAAKGAFTNAVNRYMAASQFIRNRPAGTKRLFNLDASDLAREAEFRSKIADVENSVNGPVAFNGNANTMVCMSNYFAGKAGLRSYFPTTTNSEFIWGSFPDTSFGGVVTGLSQTNVGKFILKKLKLNAELDLAGVDYTVLSQLTNDNGSANGVVLGKDGNLYGTLPYAGSNYTGVIFKVTPKGVLTTLYAFPSDTNGYPVHGGAPNDLTAGSDGNLYGTTQWGGNNGEGTVFKITTGGKLTTLYSFSGGDDGGYPQAALVQGNDGNFYGTTQTGGNNGSGTLFRFTTNVNVNLATYYSFNGTNDGGYPRSALVQGTDGSFYGTTPFGGSNNMGTIFKFIPATSQTSPGVLISLYSFGAVQDVFGSALDGSNPNALVQGSDGNFYGTTQNGGNDDYNNQQNFGQDYYGGVGDGTLFSLTTNGVFTTLYTFDQNQQLGGAFPVGALVQESDGAFYGVTSGGGANGKGTIFKFKLGIAGVDLHSLVWLSDRLGDEPYYQEGLVGAGGGVFYGTTSNGKNGGTVYRLNTSDVPSIVSSPTNSTDIIGSTISLTVSATGAAPLSYQWTKNGTTLANGGHVSGAKTATLTLTGLSAADGGSYAAIVANSFGKATSAVAVVTIEVGPSITTQPPKQVKAFEGSAVNLKVAASGGLTYQWVWSGGDLVDAGNTYGTTTSNLLLNPVLTNNAGKYQVIVGGTYGSVTSTVTALTVSADSGPVTVTISTPAIGARTTNGLISGTAADVAQVVAVGYWLTNHNNGVTGTAGQATLSGEGTKRSWTIPVTPLPGSNTVTVQSTNFWGKASTVASRSFFYEVPTPFSLTRTPGGTISGTASVHGDVPPTNNARLNLGEVYTLTATPSNSWWFTNWTSGSYIVGTNPTLSFIMWDGASFQANFVTNLFAAMAGTYNGLFDISDEVGMTEETSGMIANLSLNPKGTYSYTLLLAGSVYRNLGGTFSRLTGMATNVVTRPASSGGNVKVYLALQWDNYPPHQITGAVVGTNTVVIAGTNSAGWASSNLTLYASLTNNPGSGAYTMLVLPGNNDTPPGYGYALLTNHAGSVTILGALADGASLPSQNVPIGENNEIPVYDNLYSGSGLLSGWISLTNLDGTQLRSLTWLKKALRAPAIYTNGFTNMITVLGSPWTNPPPKTAAVDVPEGQMFIWGGGPAQELMFMVGVSSNNTLIKLTNSPATNSLSGAITPKTGLLNVTIGAGGKTPITGAGAVLQTTHSAGGFFVTKTNAGSISLYWP